jgi:hypothetical protein
VPFRGQNGKLVIVVDAVRLIPRLWDGQRFLRFLTGLAMLALAFAAHAGLTGPAAAPAPATAVTVVETAADVPATVGHQDDGAITSDAAVTSDAEPGVPEPVGATAGITGEQAVAPQSVELSGFGTRGPPLR